jgi:O-methyltransferase involved in polyketide biosynthesis
MASIGPTAFYTGEVWARNGLSHPELSRPEGRVLHALPAPLRVAGRVLGLPTLDGMLLGRHLVIDALLEDEIAAGRVGQVLEIASGMSPRGWRFTERHADLVYVETDLPDMAARKRKALARIGRPPGHRVAELDALAADGPLSVDAVAAALDRDAGLAIVTEGLLSYLPRPAVLGLWAGVARVLAGFTRGGVYLADLHVGADAPALLTRVATGALSAFVRSPVGVHFAAQDDARAALLRAGFTQAEVAQASAHPAAARLRGAERVRVVRALYFDPDRGR